MKTKISKRTVMIEAWGLFNDFKKKPMYGLMKNQLRFGYFLKKAWRIVKDRVAYYSNRNDFTASAQPVISVDYIGSKAAYDSYYANTKYFGD